MFKNDRVTGYLDVKVSSRSRRGFRPWKAWKKQWCEICRLDSIENGVEIKLKTSEEGNLINRLVLPRSSTVCRTESRTKQYAFGVFSLTQNKKPILFLSGSSESDAQKWMFAIRRMLSIASYIPVGGSSFHVSLVDNAHSRAAGLLGTFGVLTADSDEVVISDPCTGKPKVSWKWYMFHQFHLQVPLKSMDEKTVIVMHTSSEFPSGPGQLFLHCLRGLRLLRVLTSRGRPNTFSFGAPAGPKRLSRSEGDLRSCVSSGDSPICPRSQTGSDDSGVRMSVGSEEGPQGVGDDMVDVGNILDANSMGLTVKTPGGSETEDSLQDLADNVDQTKTKTIPRNESGISIASGIYEEIDETQIKERIQEFVNHVYENPLEIILESKKYFKPPPLPPRRLESPLKSKGSKTDKETHSSIKARCNTLPAKDLSKISRLFTAAESEYVVMSPGKNKETPNKKQESEAVVENFYMPMSPMAHSKPV
ncbi:unnamed protein product [Acanthoscelides obtectus]|uniref:PH domain-containing protein n=1 Tax=Acanthoscelides obtectus TaxID=200917 RepID=A0A9P0P455_ACAOB|nr:unnamed protein product [Acanthoscelides obtectus]CAK1622858.1 hypothetical protein AOBTE_LOCUS1699 [Acanthoscelides obtectus]